MVAGAALAVTALLGSGRIRHDEVFQQGMERCTALGICGTSMTSSARAREAQSPVRWLSARLPGATGPLPRSPFLRDAPLCDVCRHLAVFRTATKVWRAWSIPFSLVLTPTPPCWRRRPANTRERGTRAWPSRCTSVTARATAPAAPRAGTRNALPDHAGGLHAAATPSGSVQVGRPGRDQPGLCGRRLGPAPVATRLTQPGRPPKPAALLTRQGLADRSAAAAAARSRSARSWAAARTASRHACSVHAGSHRRT